MKIALVLSVIATIATTMAYASRGAVRKQKLSLNEARSLAEKASPDSAIPITMNEMVLRQLNRFIATPGSRQHVRDALLRMPRYKDLIERKFDGTDVPKELIAIPFHESGFKNVLSSGTMRPAGIWQFTPGTARRYRLTVSAKRDDRFNPEKETQAAVKYLKDLNSKFHDWRLAIKAFNKGEGQLKKLIAKHGTRDPWALERHSRGEAYLASIMATILIMKNPSLVD